MADELTLTLEAAHSINTDPANPDHVRLYGPNGDGVGGDPALKAAVERAYAGAHPERDRSIRKELGLPQILPEPRTLEEYKAMNDKAFANWEAEQKAKGQEAPPAPAGDHGPGYEAAKESFRQDLGMDSGPEFEAHVSNMNTWVNESFGSVAEFDKLAAAAEEALGVKGAAELALKLAGAHARKRR